MDKSHFALEQEVLQNWLGIYNMKDDLKLQKMMNAFSSYLCNSDPFYKYNHPFLPSKFKSFLKFSKDASEKCKTLKLSLAVLSKYNRLVTKPLFIDPQITINDLFSIKTNSPIFLHKGYSLSGASTSKDILTFSSKEISLSPLSVSLSSKCGDGKKETDLMNFFKELDKTLGRKMDGKL